MQQYINLDQETSKEENIFSFLVVLMVAFHVYHPPAIPISFGEILMFLTIPLYFKRGEKLNLIMYGNQSYYKGTDILVDAIALLSKDVKAKVHTLIVGKIDSNYYAELKEKSKNLDIEWIPEYVPDETLYQRIMESDVIVLPYRKISQSGVLLLALNFERMIIASDLPSFKETLVGFEEYSFFESGNAECLSDKIYQCFYSLHEKKDYMDAVMRMKKMYSWYSIAKNIVKTFIRD